MIGHKTYTERLPSLLTSCACVHACASIKPTQSACRPCCRHVLACMRVHHNTASTRSPALSLWRRRCCTCSLSLTLSLSHIRRWRSWFTRSFLASIMLSGNDSSSKWFCHPPAHPRQRHRFKTFRAFPSARPAHRNGVSKVSMEKTVLPPPMPNPSLAHSLNAHLHSLTNPYLLVWITVDSLT